MGVAVAALPEVDRQSPPPEIFDYKTLGHLRTSNYNYCTECMPIPSVRQCLSRSQTCYPVTGSPVLKERQRAGAPGPGWAPCHDVHQSSRSNDYRGWARSCRITPCLIPS